MNGDVYTSLFLRGTFSFNRLNTVYSQFFVRLHRRNKKADGGTQNE